MKKAKITKIASSWLDYPSKENQCITIYFLGCDFRCPNCHNSSLQSIFDAEFIEETVESLFEQVEFRAKRSLTRKIVLMGGDPLSSYNIDFVKEFLVKLKENDYEICVYTGNDVDFVKFEGITSFTYLKCGQYDKNASQSSQKTDEFFVLGSKNQEIYDSNFNLLSKDGIMYF